MNDPAMGRAEFSNSLDDQPDWENFETVEAMLEAFETKLQQKYRYIWLYRRGFFRPKGSRKRKEDFLLYWWSQSLENFYGHRPEPQRGFTPTHEKVDYEPAVAHSPEADQAALMALLAKGWGNP